MTTTLADPRADILARAREARRSGARNSIATIENAAEERLSRLDPARRSAVEKRLGQMPKNCRKTYLLALGGRSPKAAIRSFCCECCAWQRAEVRRCTAPACPLYAYRPFREKGNVERHEPHGKASGGPEPEGTGD